MLARVSMLGKSGNRLNSRGTAGTCVLSSVMVCGSSNLGGGALRLPVLLISSFVSSYILPGDRINP